MTIKEMIDDMKVQLKIINLRYDETGDNYYKGYMSAYAGVINKLEEIIKDGKGK